MSLPPTNLCQCAAKVGVKRIKTIMGTTEAEISNSSSCHSSRHDNSSNIYTILKNFSNTLLGLKGFLRSVGD
jgi:hypothetical protein